MRPDKRQGRLAAAIGLLMIASVLAVGPVEAEATGDTDAFLGQLQRNLDLAGVLMETDDPIASAKLATAWQAATLGVALESVPAPRHDAPSAAVLALVERHGVTPTDEQMAQVLALDDLPAVQREALVGVVDAFLALEDATRIAYQDADLNALLALAEDDADGGATSLVDAGVRVGLILGTRNDFLDATQAFHEVFGYVSSPSTTSNDPGVNLCPAVALDLDGVDTTYNDNCALVLDVGGNDTYLNNAGGSKLFGDSCTLGVGVGAAGAVVDLDGDDHYTSGGRCGYNGGGDFGVGFLLDQAGNDSYTAGDQGTNGGGNAGVGFLMDQAGNDSYTAGDHGTNGGGSAGVGFLLDQAGSDTYTAGDRGTNGGGHVGVGFLLSQAGNDSYTAGDHGTNGGGSAGVGFLLDQAGDDFYHASGSSGTNGGGSTGVGLLLDASGTDGYQVGSGPIAMDETIVPKGTGAQVDMPPAIDHDTGCDPVPSGFGDTVTCWAWVEVDGERVIDEEEDVTVPAQPVVDHDAGCSPTTPGLGDTVTCWAWVTVDGEFVIDEEEDVSVPAEPVADHDAGCDPALPGFGDTITCWAWVEVNGERVIDEERSEELPGGGSQTTEKQFLHEDNVTVTPSQDVPPEDQEGTQTPDYPGTDPVPTPNYNGTEPVATPDYPGTDPKETPDHNGTDPEPTPDYPGTDPVPTPEAGERVATVTVRDAAGDLVCVDVTPEGDSAIPVACLDRDRLGPADPHVPRGETEVFYLSEEETPDVPGTDPEPVPDVPGTDPQPVPDVPGTDPQPVPDVPGTPPVGVPDVPGTPPQPIPDVPPVPGGSLGTTPNVTVSLDVSYRYDPGRLNHEGSFLGRDVWSPAGPGDEAWYLASGEDVGMTVTLSVYEDGEHVATVPVFVPYLGQALAAAEASAGTL